MTRSSPRPSTCSSSRSRPSPSAGSTTSSRWTTSGPATSNVGTTWQVITNLLQAEKPAVPVEVIKPPEGATGWSDTWMVNSKSKNLACSYAYIDYLVSPKTNAEIAEWFGEAPGNSKSCAGRPPRSDSRWRPLQDLPRRRRRLLEDIWYWQTPEATCVDGRTDVKCKDFDEWIKAWTEVKG